MSIEDTLSASVGSPSEEDPSANAVEYGHTNSTVSTVMVEDDAPLSEPVIATAILHVGDVEVEKELNMSELVSLTLAAAEKLDSSDDDSDEDFIPRGPGRGQTNSGVQNTISPQTNKPSSQTNSSDTAKSAKTVQKTPAASKTAATSTVSKDDNKKKVASNGPQQAKPLKRKEGH